MARSKASTWLIRLIVLAALAGVVFLGLAAFRVGPEPTIEIVAGLPGIGKATPIAVTVAEPKRGLSDVRIELVQGEQSWLVEQKQYDDTQPSWRPWGPGTDRETFQVVVGSDNVADLQEGSATVRVIAGRASSWFRHPAAVVAEQELPVKLRPPSIQVTSSRTYVSQGGAEAVVYRVGPSSVKDGVTIGDWFFPGYPLPGGGEQERFALFGVPFDMSDPSQIRLTAEDDVGNARQVAFVDRFTPRPFREDTIPVSDAFMQKVVPPILEQSPQIKDQGDLLQNYLEINNKLRSINAAEIVDLSKGSREAFLWTKPFLPMKNAKVTSNFADRRSYVYNGSVVDRQDHLGFDLASTSRAPIQAANDGVVVLARYFGIYGNAVIIDHGYGLQSLYGHLSSLDVEEGQEVQLGEVIGRSGATGLAGGDHLHFSMLIHGLSVNPREWWDGHWIEDRLDLKLGPALPYGN